MIASGEKTARPDGRRPAAEAGSFFVAAIVLSSSLWPIGFNLGAYGAVFYEHLFRIWASSIAALIAGLLIGHRAGADGRYLTRLSALALPLPSIWFVFEAVAYQHNEGLLAWCRGLLAFATCCVALPYIGYIILTTALPEALEVKSRRYAIGLVGICALILIVSTLAGQYNFLIMTCDDFAIAGAKKPGNCWSERAQQ